MKKIRNIHPGQILREEFMLPLGIGISRLSKDINLSIGKVSLIIKGKQRINADIALRLSKYFGNSAKFWLGVQDDYDIEEERTNKQRILNSIKQNTSAA